MKYYILRFSLILTLASSAFAQFPLSIPTRPTSFPLQRTNSGGSIIALNGPIFYGQIINIPGDLTDVIQVCPAYVNVLALTSNGTVISWGADWSGVNDLPQNLTDVVEISSRYYYCLALKSDGTVIGWNGPPVPSSLNQVVQISAGESHALALKSNGTVVAWGSGDGVSYGATNVPSNLNNVVQIVAGRYHSVALKSDGTVVAWGSISNGATSVPMGLSSVVYISDSGENQTLALKSDGTVVEWGVRTANGNSGSIVPTNLNQVIQVESTPFAGGVALTSSGYLLSWPENFDSSFLNYILEYADIKKISSGHSGVFAIFNHKLRILPLHESSLASPRNKPLTYQVYAQGGTPPYFWNVSYGALPEGLSLNNEGIISGIPSISGNNFFSLEVIDSAGASATQNLAIRIIPEVASGDGYFFRHLAGGFAGSADGDQNDALFNSPSGIFVDALGNLFISDSENNAIRKISVSGDVELFAGSFLGSGVNDGWSSDSRFSNPQGLAADSSGNLFVAESGSHRIRKVSPFGQVTHYVGGIGFSGSADGSPTAARFNQPTDVAVDSGGNIYVADSGNHAIRRIAANGTVSTWAGTMGAAGNINGNGTAARFRSPQGVAVDGSGNVYVADTGNSMIRKISTSRVVTTLDGAAFTGSAGEGYGRASFTGSAYAAFLGSADSDFPQSVDGVGTAARFSFPTDIEVDSAGNLFVTDSGTSKIRKISTDGTVTTLGDTPEGFFYNPLDLAVSANGTIFVADTGDNRIAMSFTPAPEITIELPGGISLLNNESATTFGAFLLQNTTPRTYTVRNTGFVELDSLSVTKTGTNAAEFTLGSLGATSLAPGNSTTFSVSFTPTSGGHRTAQLSIASNDPVNNPFLVNLSGFGLSTTLDTDGDGVSDAAEYHMAPLGFDWETTQTEMANAYLAGVNAGGLYTGEQLQALNIDTPLISKNATTGEFELTVELQKSTNLQSFQHFSLQDTDTTIEPDGRLKIRFSVPDNAAFFRLRAE